MVSWSIPCSPLLRIWRIPGAWQDDSSKSSWCLPVNQSGCRRVIQICVYDICHVAETTAAETNASMPVFLTCCLTVVQFNEFAQFKFCCGRVRVRLPDYLPQLRNGWQPRRYLIMHPKLAWLKLWSEPKSCGMLQRHTKRCSGADESPMRRSNRSEMTWLTLCMTALSLTPSFSAQCCVIGSLRGGQDSWTVQGISFKRSENDSDTGQAPKSFCHPLSRGWTVSGAVQALRSIWRAIEGRWEQAEQFQEAWD